MKVMKFGGGCLGDAEGFLKIVQIIHNERPRKAAVVVSAVYGVTDKLEAALETALHSEDSILELTNEIHTIHHSIVQSLVNNSNLLAETEKLLESRIKLDRLLYGVTYIGEITETVRILVLSQGERLAAITLAAVFQDRGIKAKALESDEIGVLTDTVCDNATANLSAVKHNLGKEVVPLIRQGVIPIITGFFGCTPDGRVSSFGRNGSDYRAAVIAYGLKAKSIDIWKGVDGFMTADPKIIKSATRIKTLSYFEAAELSYFGARVLHPRTVEPLAGTGIKIYIRNIHAPKNSVTVIQTEGEEKDDIVKSVTYNDSIVVLKIHGAGVGSKPGIIGEIGNMMSDAKINIHSILTSQTCINLLLDAADAGRSVDALRSLVGGVIESLELMTDVALIAVVGEGLISAEGLAAGVLTAVAKLGINVEMTAAGASEVAYYIIIKKGAMNAAITAVHERYFS